MSKLKTHLFTALFVVLFALTLRVYLMVKGGVYHEMGIDSFFYHSEVNVLLKYHHFTWWLNILSIWGLYPYSDSPAAPTYVAELASISGLSVEYSILVYDFIIVFFGTISMYVLTLKIKRNNLFAFSTSFVFSIAPIIVPWTMWGLGEREFLVYYIPLLTILIVYIINKKKLGTMFIIFLISTFVLSTIHLMFIFLYGLIIAPFFMWIDHKIPLFKPIMFKLHINRWLKGTVFLGIFLMFFYSLFVLDVFISLPYSFSITNYSKTALFAGTSPVIILLNIFVSISGAVGVLVPLFLPIGLLYIMFKKRNNNVEKYLLWALVFSVPIVINRLYSRPVTVFFASIYIGYGVWIFWRHLNFDRIKVWKILKLSLVVLLFISTSLFTVWYVQHIESRHNSVVEYSYFATASTYEIGIYQKVNLRKIWIINDWLTGQRIQAYSGIPEQPGMMGSQLIYNPVYFNLVNKSVLKIKFSESSFKYSNRWFTSEYYQIQNRDYYYLFLHDYTASQKIVDTYKINYVIEYLHAKNKLVLFYSQHTANSLFLKTVKDHVYTVYQNKEYRCYLS